MDMYAHEQLRNINRYYFLPLLDEKIPYREGIAGAVSKKREEIKALVEEWDNLTEKCNFSKKLTMNEGEKAFKTKLAETQAKVQPAT